VTTTSARTTPELTDPATAGSIAAQPLLGEHFVGRRYVQLVLVLGALSAVGPLTIDTYLPALPTLSAELGASDVQAQTTITGLLIGLGLGQLVVGPLSDAFGRRRPLLLGLSLHAVASLLCAIAPSIAMLTVTRTLQGLAGAAVAVVAMAMVRDLFSGYRAAQVLSRLVLVLGVAPILAPSLGSGLLTVTSWRGIFVVLAGIALLLIVVAFLALPETLPPSRRMAPSFAATRKAYAGLLHDGTFVLLVVIAAVLFSTLFAYIAGSPFVLQDIYGLSPQQFGIAFGLNAVGLIIATQVNPLLLKHYTPMRILTVAIIVAFAAAVVLLGFVVTGVGGLLGFVIPLGVVLAAIGMSFPNAPAVALSRHGESAGTAAALLGAAQFGIGGMIAPVVGLLSNGTPVPLAAVIVTTTGLAALLTLLGRRRLNAS
jgi:MFS transporter, DHA1 family, multidrug resistance protein